MLRTIRDGFVLCAVVSLVNAVPASAQSAEDNIAKAQQTLAQIERLLDQIHSRGLNTAARATSPTDTGWDMLFDGKSLTGWKRTEFTGGGNVHLEKSFRGGAPAIVVDAGTSLSGFNWTQDAPKTNYEITLEAMKIEGGDFMCGLTFPVGESYASLILGGWGGTVAGVSSIDGHDASENETSQFLSFPNDRWYAIRMRVTPTRLQAWLDDKRIVDVDTTGKTISLRRGEISKSVPIGVSTYQTSSAFRAIRLRRLEAKSKTTE